MEMKNGSALSGLRVLDLLCGIRLRRPHLAHTDDVGVVPQGHVQQHILIDILLGVLALTGDGVDDAVAHPAIFLPHQVQLTGAHCSCGTVSLYSVIR